MLPTSGARAAANPAPWQPPRALRRRHWTPLVAGDAHLGARHPLSAPFSTSVTREVGNPGSIGSDSNDFTTSVVQRVTDRDRGAIHLGAVGRDVNAVLRRCGLPRYCTASISRSIVMRPTRSVGLRDRLGTSEPRLGVQQDELRDFLQGRLHVFGGDGLRLGDGGGEEGVMREAVGLARQAARRLEDCLDGWGLEERHLGPGEAEAMGEVGPHLVTREAPHMGADDDALGERIEGGHAHAAAQLRMANEDHGDFGHHQRGIRAPAGSTRSYEPSFSSPHPPSGWKGQLSRIAPSHAR